MGRIVGQRSFRVERHLLSTFNDQREPKRSLNDSVPIDAPPVGSSEEESDVDDPTSERQSARGSSHSSGFSQTGGPLPTERADCNTEEASDKKRPVNLDVSSDDDEPARGSIRKTTFGPSKKQAGSNVASPRTLRSQGKTIPNPSITVEKGWKAPDQINDSEDFVTEAANRKTKKVQRGYGVKDRARQKQLREMSGETKGAMLGASAFKRPTSISLSPERPKGRGFKAPPSASGITPDRKVGPKFKTQLKPLADSPVKSLGFRIPAAGLDLDPDLDPSISTRTTGTAKRRKISGDPRSLEESKAPVAIFKMPKLEDFESQDMEVSILGSRSDEDILADGTLSQRESTPPEVSVCPICDEAVEADLLRRFSQGGSIMTLRMQQLFCRTHKKQSVKDSWTAKGYPHIDWDGLDTRLDRHRQFLQKILDGGPSHFGQILDDHIRTGKQRTLLKSENIIAPGYYGPRGLRVVQDHVIRNFSAVLRKKAINDRQVSARGYGHYVQAVLVPELVVKLIVEDMDVTIEEARRIMEESAKDGELLNEDLGDVATESKEEEKPEELW